MAKISDKQNTYKGKAAKPTTVTRNTTESGKNLESTKTAKTYAPGTGSGATTSAGRRTAAPNRTNMEALNVVKRAAAQSRLQPIKTESEHKKAAPTRGTNVQKSKYVEELAKRAGSKNTKKR